MDYPKLDRTQFKRQSFDEADHTRDFWMSKTPEERLRAAWLLICSVFGIDPESPPRMNRNVFAARKHTL
ncbi:MAG TPA: hypothetical protein PKE06_03860 [Flavilitoribacter sp.]|nr:hypothetical protein [Flavilitoribacter sp.]HMQ86856.1 hypothetical protein [Flavilitoribacter sp.]